MVPHTYKHYGTTARLISSWYHREKGEKVAKVDNVENMEKRESEPKELADKTVKVTETNRKRINTLVGNLSSDGERHSQNDAVNYLFDCKEKLELMKKENKNEG